jgi:large subunit ribosomal protein L13e
MKSNLPIAVIKNRKDPQNLVKEGKGFSLGELSKAEISLEIAKKAGLSIDSRRRSTHEENIKILKEWLGKVDKSKLIKLRIKHKGLFAFTGKNKRRVYRGLSSAGKKTRGLRKSRGLKNTVLYKWKKS